MMEARSRRAATTARPAGGFILVTSDPRTQNGRKAWARSLVRDRLQRAKWPIYERTRHRDEFAPGVGVLFYIGGSRREAGTVVASAEVSSVRDWCYDDGLVDPARYQTPLPTKVLHLRNIEWLQRPFKFREALEGLSFCPKNLTKWGVVLIGGVRQVTQRDWDILLENGRGRPDPE